VETGVKGLWAVLASERWCGLRCDEIQINQLESQHLFGQQRSHTYLWSMTTDVETTIRLPDSP